MQAIFQTSFDRPGQGNGRWAMAGMLMIGLHVGGGAAGYFYWDRAPAELILPPATVIAFELAPAPVAPPPPQNMPQPAPEPEPQVELPPLAELADIPPAPPEVNVAVAVPEKPKPAKKKKKKKDAEKKKPKPVEAPVFKTATEAPSTAKAESPPQPVVAVAPVAAGPAPDEVARISNATNQWELAFRKHIEKYRRYPKVAKRKHQEGTPVVNFVFDRTGNVIEARITRSSGFAALDEEAIATFQRASPLPPLPPEVAGERLQRSIAINFNLK
ncbi:energy transducer TonB [Dongia sp.]|jgi:protein TonB|uniref:energy transducer TonB n=1 Tax=Dongia sp. TaxID=1977262 RepID=UPI0035AF022F